MIGKTIGRYQILGELGRGAMTIVYLAYDPAFERQVAVKVLVRHVLNDPTFRRRFRHEMKMIATLEHPAIVPAYDWGEDDGHLFMAMRLMSGGSLSDYLNNGALPLTMILHIISHLAPALDEAHARGIVHGDLKPSKILFDESGMPYINGFGTTKPIMGSMTRLTLSYPLIGTFAYMSPEQALGEENIDGRSDIYSLGVILFEMLSGRLPYDANTPASFIYQHIHKPIPNIRSFRPDLPLHCQTVIDRAMAKLPQARYPTAAALSADLTAPVPLWQRYPPSAPPAAYSQPMVLIKFSLFAVVLLFFGIVIFSGITILSAPTPGPELAVPWVEANWWIPALVVMLVLAYTLARSRLAPDKPMSPSTKPESIPKTPSLDTTTDPPTTEAFAMADIKGVKDGESLEIGAQYKLLAGILREIPEGVRVQRFHLPDVEEVEMDVVVRASGFEISPDWHQRVKVIRGQDSELLEFILVPKETGEKKIEVEFLYERHWLTAIVLDVTVVASDEGGV